MAEGGSFLDDALSWAGSSSGIGTIGAVTGGLLGLLGSINRSSLDYGRERREINDFSNLAGAKSNEMYNYGKDFMNPNSGWYTGALAGIGRQTDSIMDSMRNQSTIGLGANAYQRMISRLRRQAMDSTMGAFGDVYRQGAQTGMGLFGLSKDFSGQQLNGMQIGAAMKEKEWESKNAPWESLQKAGFGLAGTLGGSLIGNIGGKHDLGNIGGKHE